MSSSSRLQVVFICFVPNTGKRVIILDVLMAMHWRQDSTTPDHGMTILEACKGLDAKPAGCLRKHALNFPSVIFLLLPSNYHWFSGPPMGLISLPILRNYYL